MKRNDENRGKWNEKLPCKSCGKTKWQTVFDESDVDFRFSCLTCGCLNVLSKEPKSRPD